jgi:ATP-dependent Clp protease protease subunit
LKIPSVEYSLYPRYDKNGYGVDRSCMVGQMEHMRLKHRVLAIGDFDWEMESSNVLLAMDSMSNEPITLLINSCGGVLDVAFMLYDTIKLINSPVITVGKFVASAAVIALAAGSKRYLLPHSRIMMHLPLGQISGDTKDIDIAQKEFVKYKDAMIKIYQDCGVTSSKSKILKDIDREFWMNAEETIAYGLADEILTPEKYKELFKEIKNV